MAGANAQGANQDPFNMDGRYMGQNQAVKDMQRY